MRAAFEFLLGWSASSKSRAIFSVGVAGFPEGTLPQLANHAMAAPHGKGDAGGRNLSSHTACSSHNADFFEVVIMSPAISGDEGPPRS